MWILIPTILHQLPQLVREDWMLWPFRALSTNYRIYSCHIRYPIERDRAGECLDRCGAAVRGWYRKTFITYLYHHHSKGKNVRLFTACPTLQDLRRCPSRGVIAVTRGTLIQVLHDYGQSKIRDSRMTGVIHKDVTLAEREYNFEAKFRATHSFEVAMDLVAGMQVVQTLCNIR